MLCQFQQNCIITEPGMYQQAHDKEKDNIIQRLQIVKKIKNS